MITRRSFMRMVAGGLVGTKIGLGKSKLPIDNQLVLEFPTKGKWLVDDMTKCGHPADGWNGKNNFVLTPNK